MGLLQLLAKLFGKSYLNKIMGTRTNVAKPIKMDKDSPFKKYSDDAFNDPKSLEYIEKKINEYGPYALSNKNPQELANFEANAKRLLEAKNKQTGTTPGMQKAMEPKSEAEMFDFETKQKLDDKGIMTLKEDMGLPPDVAPDSSMGKILTSRNKINQTLKGMGKAAEDIGAKAYSADIEGKRRAVMRQILLRDSRIKLPREVEVSLEDMKDLGKNADPNMDPLVLFDKYYKRDNKKLEMLDGIIDESLNPVDAADNFLVKDDTIELLDDDLGTKLKKADDDPDMPEMAEGGRIGYAVGTGLRLYKFFKDKGKDLAKELKKAVDDIFPSGDRKLDADVVVDNMLEDLGVDRDMFDQKDISNLYGMAYDTISQGSVPKGLAGFMTKKGKGKVKTADEIEVSQDVKDKVEFDKQRMEDNFTQEMAPQMYERMQLKIKYPGITDDLIEKIMVDDNPQRKAEVLAAMDEAFKMMDKGMSSDEILNIIKNTTRTKQAGGGLSYLMGM
jgi:hypothetical protein